MVRHRTSLTPPGETQRLMDMRAGQEAIMDRAEAAAGPRPVPLWQEVELEILVRGQWKNPYSDADLWVDFVHESGRTLRRPAFWDGDDVWRVRFSPPEPGRWEWSGHGTVQPDLPVTSGTLEAATAAAMGHAFYDHGFWRMSPRGRSLVHADGTPAILAADTAWGLPWRATVEDAREYAADRQAKGFNAVFLMSVQPDMRARGPRERTLD